MRNELWIPFFKAVDNSRGGLLPIVETGFSSDSHVSSLTRQFRVSCRQDAVAFRIAAKEIAKTCNGSFLTIKSKVEFPVTDFDSQRTYFPSIEFSFTGCWDNVSRSVEALKKCAQGERPGFDDPDFWQADVDPEAVYFERRQRVLERSKGLPVGMIDKRNSVFIVNGEQQEHAVRDFLKLSVQP